MAGTCSSCGAYFSGWKCTSCEQTELMKKSIRQQQDLSEKNRRAADYDARMNREMQEEQEMRARQRELFAQMQAELEDMVKQSFAEIALLIQTNTAETIAQKFEDYCRSANAEFDPVALKETGGVFTPLRAKIYRKQFTEYILNNPAKAPEIAIAKSLFELHAKTAQEVWDANEALEAKNKKIQEEKVNDERIAREAELNAAASVKEAKWKKVQYVALFFTFALIGFSISEFKRSNILKGLLFVGGAMFFALIAWICEADGETTDDNGFLNGFLKGLNK